MKIGLNIGHYGTKGAIGFLDEANCAVEIYNELKPLLESEGHSVISCNSAKQPDYKSATNIANMYNLDLLISIHLNSHTDKKSNGTEVLYYKGNDKGRKYAEELSASISYALGTTNRGAKPKTDVYIISKTKATCVLLECLFVSNESDSKKYNAKTIAKAVANCLRDKTKEVETVEDIVSEFERIGIVTNRNLWLNKLQCDINVYWLARKAINYIRSIEV